MEQSIGQRLKWQVILFLARRLPPCNVLLPLFSEERERPLTLREKITKKLHLFTCEACRRYIAQIEQMSEMVKPQNEMETSVAPPAKLSDDARKRIKDALEAAVHHKN
jgi:predicted anti-sigma-YlaC factor YlaD